ncbi:hypothetical protein HO173_012916 [Letharia columbiana]|uniref:Uncharacterized protein n=1 Tax=Letharia columbiana TaxID=112416 RepID=A0A8H6FDT0_9LECA|nr:uncharacterized protein HO173_012916 [Letharia columbiana]KAF6224675.1 hypothetical protein HO173_012916 [Letharia columbiana]
MYIPELDALIFLATEFLEGGADRPILATGIRALHEAAALVSNNGVQATVGFVQEYLSLLVIQQNAAGFLKDLPGETYLQQLTPEYIDDLLPVIWEALGGGDDIAFVTVGLLLAFVCQAEFDATAAFVFWMLDK